MTDRLTGLVWHCVANLAPEGVTWQESLADCAAANPALPPDHSFAEVRDVYWSSTTSLYEPDWACALYLDKGAVGVGQKSQVRFYVWPVRESHVQC